MSGITPAMRKLLVAMLDGTAHIGNRALAPHVNGERVMVMPETTLRCLADGLIYFVEPRRLDLTPTGRTVAGTPQRQAAELPAPMAIRGTAHAVEPHPSLDDA